jgi:hypothetical protein
MDSLHALRARTCLLGVVGLSALAACASTTQPPPTKRTTAALSSNPLEIKDAVAAITKAKCHKEDSCRRIGDGRQFVTEGDCENLVATDLRQILNTTACDTGFVESESLGECLSAIRSDGCGAGPSRYCDAPRICSP